MISKENTTGYACCSAVARRFGGLSSAVRPVRKGPVFPFGFASPGAVCAESVQIGSVSAGAEGVFARFSLGRRGNSGECIRESVGEFTGNTGGNSALNRGGLQKNRNSRRKAVAILGGMG